MPSILNLKFKGNKSFVAFSNLNDSEALTKTWKVCTKVASYLEQGQRLENLSWRLWHLQTLMVDADNAKSKREFRRLSKCMGDKLDKEKGRSIEELEAPDFRNNPSAELIRQRAAEKERDREASHNAQPGTIKRLQFTFSVEKPIPVEDPPTTRSKSNSVVFTRRTSTPTQRVVAAAAAENHSNDIIMADEIHDDNPNNQLSLTQRGRKSVSTSDDPRALFSNDFGPSALLMNTTLTNRTNNGDGAAPNSVQDGFGVVRPMITIPIDDILTQTESTDSPWSTSYVSSNNDEHMSPLISAIFPPRDHDVTMRSTPTATTFISHDPRQHDEEESENSNDDCSECDTASIPPLSQTAKAILPKSLSTPTRSGSGGNGLNGRPTLTVRTQTAANTRSSGPGATATSINSAGLRHTANNNNSAPGGQKAECSNCGATHTPLWRRGLNDELNCNACGLYCKLHKRPRPKSMRNTHGEGRPQAAPRQECVDVMGMPQCYNCHTTATPLWRKDDEGKTVCNACGLYYKLHGSARPISMKSDVIRKRSRHETRRVGAGIVETPTASPVVSPHPSPAREISPILAPDSTTQISYNYHEEPDYRPSQSELMGALGNPETPQHQHQHRIYHHTKTTSFSTSCQLTFPGPYHPDYLMQMFNVPPADPLPFASVEAPDLESMGMSPRTHKRRRMSTDSASEPPSSAASYGSYTDGYSNTSSASHSQRSSMDFPFSSYPAYNILRGSSSTLWHPPMRLQDSPQVIHPPMLPPTDSTMDFLHPPMIPHEEGGLFTPYLHPPMLPPDETNANLGHGNCIGPNLQPMQPHPPMFPNDTSVYAVAVAVAHQGGASPPGANHQEHYDSNMRAF